MNSLKIEFSKNAKRIGAILVFVLLFMTHGNSLAQLVYPIEDGYARSNQATTNYENTVDSIVLNIRHQAGELIRYGYLKFVIPQTYEGTDYDAKLKLYVFNNNNLNAVNLWFLRAENTWTDATLTWENRPPVIAGEDTVKVNVLEGSTSGTIEVDVTSFVVGKEGDSITFMIRLDTVFSDLIKVTTSNAAETHNWPALRFEKAVTGVSLGLNATDLYVGDSVMVSAEVTPVDAYNTTIVWTSDQEEIATVDATGKVKGLAVGEANIIATSMDGGFSDTCVVNVVLQPLYTLTITNGTGSGEYHEGAIVNIVANDAPTGKEFYVWTGDVAILADPGSPSTSVTMPASHVSVTATYEDIVLARKDINRSSILIFPNPASKGVTISGSEAIDKLTVYTISGEIVLDKVVDNKKEVYLNTESLKEGQYLLKISILGGEYQIMQLVKTK